MPAHLGICLILKHLRRKGRSVQACSQIGFGRRVGGWAWEGTL